MERRNPIIFLKLSVRFSKEYLEKLNELHKSHSLEEIEESKDLTIAQRAFWTALIIEIGCLFDTYSSKDKEVISLKNIDSLKEKIDRIHGEKIIEQIITTRKTFTAHKGEKKNKPVSVDEICNSKLKKLLDELEVVLSNAGIK